GADPTECESCLGFDYFAVHFEQWIDEKIDRAARRLRVNYQITAFRKFEPVGRIVPEVVISQLRILPSFADIHRNPATICQEFSPAMVAVDRALVLVGWNGCANREPSGYADAARESNEVGVKIGAIAGARVAGVQGIATAPASSRFVVAHPADHVAIDRFRAVEIVSFSRCCFLIKCLESFIKLSQFFLMQETRIFRA